MNVLATAQRLCPVGTVSMPLPNLNRKKRRQGAKAAIPESLERTVDCQLLK